MKFKMLCSAFALMWIGSTFAADNGSPVFYQDEDIQNVSQPVPKKRKINSTVEDDTILLSSQNKNSFVSNQLSPEMFVRKEIEAKDLLEMEFKELDPRLYDLKIKNLAEINPLLLGHMFNLLSDVKNLRILDLSDNQLTNLPTEIGKLTDLQELFLSTNQLTDLPEEIRNLKNLRILDLGNNQLSRLPKEVGDLVGLRGLYCFCNELTEYPKEIGKLTNLETLDLSDNLLTELPKEIESLTNLQELLLNDNQLTRLSKEIGSLINLETLDLSNNLLIELPTEMGGLTNLKDLLLNDNLLTAFPKEMGNLINLRRFDFEDLGILSISDFLNEEDEAEIKSINLSGKGLKQIPIDIVGENKLEDLNVSNNNLEDIPSLIIRCCQLKKINLSNNAKIDSEDKISDAVFGLPQLETIILTTSNGLKEYKREEISRIREQRIRMLKRRVLQEKISDRLQDKINLNILTYIFRSKNQVKVNDRYLEEMIEINKQIDRQLAKRSFRRQMLDLLMDAQQKSRLSEK